MTSAGVFVEKMLRVACFIALALTGCGVEVIMWRLAAVLRTLAATGFIV